MKRKKTFGPFLKRLRFNSNLTLREVEKETGISNAYLSQVETGQRGIPTLKLLMKLAECYDHSIFLIVKEAQKDLC